jgi:hypothetical protein
VKSCGLLKLILLESSKCDRTMYGRPRSHDRVGNKDLLTLCSSLQSKQLVFGGTGMLDAAVELIHAEKV